MEGIGAPVRRVEDARLLRGGGRFVADIVIPGELHCAIVRSPHAHAIIRSIEAARALTAPGVVAVFSGADMAADRVGPMRALWAIRGVDGTPRAEPPRWALARERVRHIGEAVAIAIAQTREQALDAAELVVIDYESLPAGVDARAATAAQAPQLHDTAPGNICFRWARGDEAAVQQALQNAAHVTRLDLINNRLIGAAIEPRAVLAAADATSEKLTLYSSTQVPHHIRRYVAEQLGMAEGGIRLIAPDVGGGFGYKGKHYPEETIVAWAARRLRQPVKWVASRSESFVSDYQGRDHLTRAELALDEHGRFRALRVDTIANVGAYVSTFGAAIPSAIYSALLAGVYRTPAIFVQVTGVFTNTLPTDAYRGAGRPEACYVLERLADRAASELAIDRAEIRKRNLIPSSAMPYKTPIGPTYDCGDFPKIFARVLTISDYAGFAKRRREAAKRGKLRGIGISCLLEHAGGLAREGAGVTFPGDDTLTTDFGVQSTGQGHATVYARLAAQRLGILAHRVRVREGDSGLGIFSTGSVGSRSTLTAGNAIAHTIAVMVEKGRNIAAHVLEAAESDIEYRDGLFAVAGTDRQITLFALAARAKELAQRGEILEDLDTKATTDTPQTFPNGCHVAEVEIDPDTGSLAVIAYMAVDDCGNVLDHTLVEGQVHGGIVQGLGQALMEAVVYDQGGQLVSGSFVDYAIPHATDVPPMMAVEQSVAATTNPLGIKGVAEAGTTASLAAIMNAIANAIPGDAGARLQMPATPEKIWAACRQI
jgi:aerobic carbon-monoxide dehydrogenase large subunit